MTMSMYRKICVTNRALAERPFLEQLACVLATKPYAMILREKDLTEEGYEELAGKVKKLCENTDTRLILHSFPDAAMHLGCTAIHMPLHRFTKMPEEQKQKFLVRGVSVHSVEDARLAEQCGATYLTAGHVFVTDCKKGLAPANKVGVVDSDYRGEIMVALHNHSNEDITIESGERVAQMVIAPYIFAEYEEVSELEDTVRGEGGFGSTGK